ncbi:MAG TPA: type II toxin-antitoxin system HipA family toxin [Conexibacter sp.]|jgi:serine/threonine-protein kinase HipA|nr:type II toxin-antitoxin system HipA family toxin [Conexibacter sp.]
MSEELIAYLADRRAGRLIRKDNGNLQFRYDEDYAGPPLSHAMPLQEEAHPHAVCRAVFGGLLPEGDGRETLARVLGVSPGNDYGLLAEVGGDCAGAITLLAPDATLDAAPSLRVLDDEQLDAILRALPRRPLGAAPEEGVRLSLAGAQPKLPVVIEDGRVALPLNSATATTHILKPEPDRFPGLVANEAFCMEVARGASLLVPEVKTATTVSGLPYLIVERYDRDLTREPIRRLHQEDVCQALGVPADRKYQSEGGPGIREVTELLRTTTAVPAHELPRLWEALVFNWMIGNCDAHGKNFSLLYDTGAPTLAPLYDLVSTTAYPELTTRLAMRIDGATDVEQVDMDAWVQLASEIGVSERFARRATKSVAERVRDAMENVSAAIRADEILATENLSPDLDSGVRSIVDRVSATARRLRRN